ncbi:MAG: uroporphyrinogen-III synthase [Candidatus Marinimicrobia bacterium]|nr:uroporphyrinogen-III synthase [Candidatus Neomarinimicrobiota bacterium]
MSKSLNDIGILVTRAAHQQAEIRALIEKEGGTPHLIPLIKIDPPESWEYTDSAISKIDSYDWILFTSVNSVDSFLKRVNHVGKNIGYLLPKKIAAVGSKTRKRLEYFGLKVSLQPKIFDSDNLLKSFKKDDIMEKRILFPGSEYGRHQLIDGLINIGAKVTSVPVYRTIPNDEVNSRKLISLFEDGVLQVATFFSPSTFKVFLSHLPIKMREKTLNKSVALAVIGATTSKYVKGLGFKADIIPEEHTVFGLIEAMKNWAMSTKSLKINELH